MCLLQSANCQIANFVYFGNVYYLTCTTVLSIHVHHWVHCWVLLAHTANLGSEWASVTARHVPGVGHGPWGPRCMGGGGPKHTVSHHVLPYPARTAVLTWVRDTQIIVYKKNNKKKLRNLI